MGFLEQWSAAEVLILVGVCAASVTLVTLILTVYRYNLRALADETALRRERQQAEIALRRELVQKNLPVQELVRCLGLVKVDEPADPQVEVSLAKALAGLYDAPSADL